jgi:hypothetical protein
MKKEKNIVNLTWREIVTFVSSILTFMSFFINIGHLDEFIQLIIKLIVSHFLIFLWGFIIYRHFFQKKYCKRKEQEIRSQIRKEHELDEQTNLLLNKFSTSTQKLLVLVSSEVPYSLYNVFNDIGRDWNMIRDNILSEINIMEDWIYCFMNHNETMIDFSLLKKELDRIMIRLEKIIEKVNKKKGEWYSDFNKRHFNKLIKEYDGLINNINDFYKKMFNKPSGFEYLSVLFEAKGI